MNSKALLAALAIIIAVIGYLSAFIVNETEQVVVTRFDKVSRTVQTPGLKFKVPIIEKAVVYPKNLQEWDGDRDQIPTSEKTYIWVDTFARWKITDPVKFFRTVKFTNAATQRLNEIIDPAIRNFITSFRLIEAVRNSNRALDTFETDFEDTKRDQPSTYFVTTGRQKISEGILEQAKPKMEQFGIALVDVKIKRINYVEEVRKSVYDRMIAERKQIAEKFRSEGQGEARKINGEKERDLKQITSEAYRKAQEIKGKADAEATKLFAEAFNLDPEFYSFTKTLQIYRESLDKNSKLILSTDSEFLRYFKGYTDKPR